MVVMESTPETRFCIACRQERPIEDFKTYLYASTRRIRQKCRLHDQRKNSALPAVRGKVSLEAEPTVHPALKTNGAYTKLFRDQNGRCAICGQPETAQDEIGQVLPLSLYGAAHYSGRVQGLLCKLCNVGLSMFRDSPALLGRAISFLTKKTPSLEGDVRSVQRC